MRITGYRTLSTLHRWNRPIGDVNGYVESGVTSIPLVLVDTDDGLTGVGLGNHDRLGSVFPALLGEDPRAVTALYDRMLAWAFKTGHGGATFGAIGALDMALWDLKAKAADQPLWRMLGARDRVVPGYASSLDGPLDDDELIRVQTAFAERGFRAVKLKGGLDLDGDLRRLALLRTSTRRRRAACRVSCSTRTSRGPARRPSPTSTGSNSRSIWPGSRSRCAGGTSTATR
ncbi:hypothetical protein GCM10027614_81580 [Micromonospora vulcania]